MPQIHNLHKSSIGLTPSLLAKGVFELGQEIDDDSTLLALGKKWSELQIIPLHEKKK